MRVEKPVHLYWVTVPEDPSEQPQRQPLRRVRSLQRRRGLALMPLQPPDVVFTDVIMGPMNGIQPAMHLAESLPACKVVLMSGHILTAALPEDLTANGHKFIMFAKPVHPRRVLDFLAARRAHHSNDG